MSGRDGRFVVRCGMAWCAFLLGSTVARAQFTPGNIVVSQYGDGVNTSSSGTVPITLREFTTGGVGGYQLVLPATSSSPNYGIVSTLGNAGGFLKRSVDGRYLTIVGLGTEATATRIVARVDASGTVDTTTRFSAGNTFYSVVSTDGTSMWLSAATGNNDTAGIRYLTLGGTTTGTRLSFGIGGSVANAQGEYSIPLNNRVDGIFDNQLYGSAAVGVGPSNSYSFRGVYNAGSGLQTSGTLYGKTIVGGGTSDSGIIDDPWEFVVVSSSSGQPSVIYVADNDSTGANVTGGVQKWLYNGVSGTWSKVWTANLTSGTGMRALTGFVSGNSVQLYGVTGSATPSGRTSLVALNDTLDSLIAPSVNLLATADANYVFRGVAFAPVPEPAAVGAGLVGLVAVALAGRRATNRRGKRG